MANVFRSKEVLKKAHKLNGDDTVVPVYGMYVTGEFVPPFIVNPTLELTKIKTTKGDIVDFTSVDLPTDSPVVNLIDMTFDPSCPDIINYTTATDSRDIDSIINILDMTFDPSCPDFISYTSDNTYCYDSIVNILDITYNPEYTTSDIPYGVMNNTPEPTLRLHAIQSIKATIT